MEHYISEHVYKFVEAMETDDNPIINIFSKWIETQLKRGIVYLNHDVAVVEFYKHIKR